MCCAWAIVSYAQIDVRLETQLTTADGDHNPLWLNANKYGLSSLDKTNGYVRASAFRGIQTDSGKKWRWGAGLDVAAATGFTSDVVVQQAFGELGFMKGQLTIGAKQQPLELKNQELSSGSQTLGINARPVPSVRLALPDYWSIPGTRDWVALKGHLSYGLTTDDHWQRNFTQQETKYTKHTMLHTKAGYLRIGQPHKPLTVELGLEMACQFGGTSYAQVTSTELSEIKNSTGLKSMLRALIPSGGEAIAIEEIYKNADGNHLGSMMARVNLDYPQWGISAYADHFFEDQSQMFLLDYDGYGTGENWDSREHSSWMLYDLRDIQLGLELRLKQCRWVETVVAEFLYSKYQSGPIYHDHTQTLSDHLGGWDDYYNHSIYTGWQHWGQVMGNPLYRSPLYNDDQLIMIEDNRFWAWHLAACGTPLPSLHYRLVCTWQRGFGTYRKPLPDPQRNLCLLAEAGYSFSQPAFLRGWDVRCGLALDRGKLLGDSFGMQLTIGKQLNFKTGRR